MLIHDASFGQVWIRLLRQLMDQPLNASPRGLPTHELLGVTLRVDDGRQNILLNPGRDLNYRFMVAEWLWISFGHNELGVIKPFNAAMEKFSDDGKTLYGAYGPRILKQLGTFVTKLLTDIDTRQAVIQILNPNPPKTKDTPCTIGFQGLVRDGQFNMIVSMRSSDIWLGLPYDFFAFSMIANSIAGFLGVKQGFVQYNLGSSHLYHSDYAKAEKAEKAWLAFATSTIESPVLPGFPPRFLDKSLITRTENYKLMDHDGVWRPYDMILSEHMTKQLSLEVLLAASRHP